MALKFKLHVIYFYFIMKNITFFPLLQTVFWYLKLNSLLLNTGLF